MTGCVAVWLYGCGSNGLLAFLQLAFPAARFSPQIVPVQIHLIKVVLCYFHFSNCCGCKCCANAQLQTLLEMLLQMVLQIANVAANCKWRCANAQMLRCPSPLLINLGYYKDNRVSCYSATATQAIVNTESY